MPKLRELQRDHGPLMEERNRLRTENIELSDAAANVFEAGLGELCEDPWALRDAYIEVLLDREVDRARFFERAGGRAISADQQARALQLLESQRAAMVMYTSCGWFFNDLSGIETIQVIRYAAHLAALLPSDSRILLIGYTYNQSETNGPPFSVSQQELETLFVEKFRIEILAEEDALWSHQGLVARGVTQLMEYAVLLTRK